MGSYYGHDWAAADAYLGAKDRRPLGGRATELARRATGGGDSIAVCYQGTDVVTYHRGGSCTLDSGGWRTLTTKDRINTYGPRAVSVSQERGVWYVNQRGAGAWASVPDKRLGVFADGMQVGADGAVSGLAPQRAEKTAARERARAQRFSAQYMAALAAGEIPPPSAGDCWYCLMVTDDGRGLGDAVRERGAGDRHIRLHMEEGYLVPSLIVRAAEAFGVSIIARQWLSAVWAGGEGAASELGYVAEIAREQLGKALTRYLYRALGTAA